MIAAALDAAPGGTLTAFLRGKYFPACRGQGLLEPGRDKLAPARALEAEARAVRVSIFAHRARRHNYPDLPVRLS